MVVRGIKYYTVVLGESFQSTALLSVRSILHHNPGIDFTVIFLNTNPDKPFKDLAKSGKIRILLDTLGKYSPPQARIIYQVFWYRYAVAPGLLGGGLLCQVDSDIICVSKFPENEIVETRINVCLDGSAEGNSSILGTLNRRNWWAPINSRSVYFNAGLIVWDHDIYGWVFDNFNKEVREDALLGAYDQAPLGDQSYLNAIINRSGESRNILNILPSKWNVGVWTIDMSENVEKLHSVKKVVNAHVFSTAGEDRQYIMSSLLEKYST